MDSEQFEQLLKILRESFEEPMPEGMKDDGSFVTALSDNSPILICAWGDSAKAFRMFLGLPHDGTPEPPKPRHDPKMN
jgi:hypothetical protein